MTGFSSFMSGGGWVFFALLSAGFSAQIYLTGQYLKQPGHLLVFWSRVATVLALTPFVLAIDWPTDPLFYGAVLLTAPLGAFADIRAFNVASDTGAGVVTRVQPLVVFLSFLLWFPFAPGLLGVYARSPWHTLGILSALAGCAYFSSRLRKCHISRSAFRRMLPVLFSYSLATVLSKYVLHLGPMTGVVYGYMYVQSAAAVLLSGVYAWRREGKAVAVAGSWRRPKMALAALLVAFGWVCSMAFRNYAMVFVINPAYLSALGQTTPLFIALFYRRVRHKEEADVASGMGIVASAALLSVLAI